MVSNHSPLFRFAAIGMAIVFLAMAAPVNADGPTNGNWSSGETGWTRWSADWSHSIDWAVTSLGPTAPEATTLITDPGQGSFGWYQIVDCPAGFTSTVNATWTGTLGNHGWIEVMLFPIDPANPGDIAGRIDTGNPLDIAYKKDSFDNINPPFTFGWQAASLSPLASGNHGSVTSLGAVVVALKFGSTTGATLSASFDDVTVVCTPEPTAAVLFILSVMLVRRRT